MLNFKKTLYYPPGGRKGRGLSDSRKSFVAARERGSGLLESESCYAVWDSAKERIFCGGARFLDTG